MSLKLITPATAMAVTLDEAKVSCRFDINDLDADITAMILDAQRLVEHEVGICIMPQTWELTFDTFPTVFALSRTPVASVTSITYLDSAGIQQTLSNTLYELDAVDTYGPAYVVPSFGTSWPSTRLHPNAVALRYTSGYPDAASVPSQIKRQIKIFVAMMLDDPLALSDRLAAIDKVWSA